MDDCLIKDMNKKEEINFLVKYKLHIEWLHLI